MPNNDLNRAASVNQGLFQIHFCVLLLAGTALFPKLISLPADVITFYRSLFGSLALMLLMAVTRAPFRSNSGRDYLMIAATGVLTGLHWVKYFQSIQTATVAIGILSLYTFPVMTSLLEPFFEREPFRGGTIGRTLIVFIGILLIIPAFELSNHTTVGVMWGLLSAALFAVRNITVRKTLSHVSSITTMGLQLVVIALMLLPFVSFHYNLIVDSRLLLLILLGIVFTAAPHAMLVAGLRRLKASTASLILCLHPMYSIILAALFIGEVPSARILLGGAVIFGIAVYESVRVRFEKRSG